MTYQDFVLTQLLGKFLMSELPEHISTCIRTAAEEIALDDWLVYVIEIAYHIGYAKSLLNDNASEVGYKTIKKSFRDNIIKKLEEGSD